MDDRKLPFTQHLSELRVRLRNALIALVLATTITWWFAKALYALLAMPLIEALAANGIDAQHVSLQFSSPLDPFWVFFEVAIYAGVFLASPVIFHQLWRFIAPGLYAREKRVAVPFAMFSAICFAGGALFCYAFVLPAMLRFLISYSSDNLGAVSMPFGVKFNVTSEAIPIAPMILIKPYLDLVTKMLLGFGLIFEMPLLIFFLSYVGLVTHRSLWRFNKYAMILSFVVGAILTPGPDIVSQLLMAAPMIVLYNASILIAWLVTRRREAAAAAPP